MTKAQPADVAFRLRGSISDIDESTTDEAPHVTTVLTVETADTFDRVLSPITY